MNALWLVALAALPEGVQSVKAYKGKDGQTVEVLRLSPKGERAAVRVCGTDSAIDGLVLDCAVSNERTGARLSTRHEGAEWSVLVQDGERFTVFVPQRPNFRVAYDEATAKAVDAAAILSEQKAQRADGRLATFEQKSWPYLWKKYGGKAEAAAGVLTRACGHPVTVGFEWHTFPDDVMADVDVWKQCEPVVQHLASRCGKGQRFDSVKCALGSDLALTRDGAALRFVTTRDGAKQAGAFLSGSKQP